MAEPMDDDALIALAQHRYDQAERRGATADDCRQLREKVDMTRDLVLVEEIDLRDPAAIARLVAAAHG